MALTDKLIETVRYMRADYINPEEDVLNQVLSMHSGEVDTLSNKELFQYIFALSKYQLFLQVQGNIRNINQLEAKRKYEFALDRAALNFNEKTIKAKEVKAKLENEDIQKLEEDYYIKEAEYLLFNKVPECVEQLINALKKEFSARNG